MSTGMKVVLWMLAGCIAIFLVMLYLGAKLPVQAHDWYKDLKDPITAKGCCHDADCKQVPDEWVKAGAVTPYFGGYQHKAHRRTGAVFQPRLQ